MRRLALALLFFAAASSAHALAVVQMTPTGGTIGGGDVVMIEVDFVPICDPLACQLTVLFGSTPARSSEFVGPHTVRVITPAHDRGSVPVTVNMGATAAAGPFRFAGMDETGSPLFSNYETVLVPFAVTSDVTPGAFGSRWTSEMWAHNAGDTRVEFFEGYPYCMLANPIGCINQPFPALSANSDRQVFTSSSVPSGAPLLYLQRGDARNASFSLRIRDTSRSTENAGTEIPLGRESSFRTDRIELLNVPFETSARTQLRIFNVDAGPASEAEVRVYAFNSTTVLASKTVTLTAPQVADNVGPSGFPHWAGVGFIDLRAEFPSIGAGAYRVEVVPVSPAGFRTWALATVTNNATQLVTAIAPQ